MLLLQGPHTDGKLSSSFHYHYTNTKTTEALSTRHVTSRGGGMSVRVRSKPMHHLCSTVRVTVLPQRLTWVRQLPDHWLSASRIIAAELLGAHY